MAVAGALPWMSPIAHAATPIIEPGNTNIALVTTGNGSASLISQKQTIQIDTNQPGGVIEFDFGFATQEGASPGQILDSVTFSLLDAAEQTGAVLLTADFNGVVLTPPSPGTITLPPGALTASSIPLPEMRVGLPNLTMQLAYHAILRVPVELFQPQVKLELDLYDYPNGLASVGWSSDVHFVADVIPSCGPPAAGLAAWWKAENDALDSVGPHHGTLHSGVGFAQGRVGLAFSFDATDASYVSVPSRAALSSQAGVFPPSADDGGEISLEAWMKMPSLAPAAGEDRRTIAAKDGEYELAVDGTGAVLFSVVGSGGATTARGGALTAGAWHHVAGTYRQGQFIRAYFDGARVGEQSAALFPSVASGTPLLLGRLSLSDAGQYFNGLLDELALYHHALGDADIAAIAASGVTGKCLTALTLRSERQGPNLRLRWLHVAGGATLQQSGALGDGAVWVPAPQAASLSGDDYVVDIPASAAAKFYRLRR